VRGTYPNCNNVSCHMDALACVLADAFRRNHLGSLHYDTSKVADMNNLVEVAQLEMQKKLGRCMLRLQQYERLLKAMVAAMSLEGNPEDWPAVRSRQEAAASKKSLGTLVGLFTGDYLTENQLTTESSTVNVAPADKAADAPWFKTRLNIAMSPERREQAKEALAELVAMRNDLVHHLIEQFDISEESGCLAATRHLQDCYQKIDDHLGQLKEWSDGQVEAQALASSFLQSKAFEDAFVHGINPDGSVCWSRSSIVEFLREAETACQVDGWTSLDVAIAFISKENRDQIPSRYGCKTWRQVLKQSGQFELRSDAGSDGAMGQAWYRSYAEDAAPEAAPSRAYE
jgi:hypothetical protein